MQNILLDSLGFLSGLRVERNGDGSRNTWKIDVWMCRFQRSVYLQTLREELSPESVWDFLSFYVK